MAIFRCEKHSIYFTTGESCPWCRADDRAQLKKERDELQTRFDRLTKAARALDSALDLDKPGGVLVVEAARHQLRRYLSDNGNEKDDQQSTAS